MTWTMSLYRFGASSQVETPTTKHQIGERERATGRVSGPAGREKAQTTAACPVASAPDWDARPETTETWWSAAWTARWCCGRW